MLVNIAAGAVGPDYRTDFKQPNSESKDVQELSVEASPDRAGFSAQIVGEAEQGIDDPAVEQLLGELFGYVASIEDISVTTRTTARDR